MPESQKHSASRENTATKGRSIRRRKLATALSIVCTLSLVGCSTSASLRSITSSGSWNDTVETLRNRSFSAKAYYRRQHNFCNHRYSKDFQAGFRAGYEAIADGKPGCPPAFPPKEYWSWEFQSAEGKARAAAWFEGYPQGVQAAREEGVNQWSTFASSSKCATGCGSTDPLAQPGCGPCGTSGGQYIQGMPMGSATHMNFGDQIIVQDEFVEGRISSPSDHGLQAPSQTATPVNQQPFVPSPFPATN